MFHDNSFYDLIILPSPLLAIVPFTVFHAIARTIAQTLGCDRDEALSLYIKFAVQELICMVHSKIFTLLFNNYGLRRPHCETHTTFSFVVRCRQPEYNPFFCFSLTHSLTWFVFSRLSLSFLDTATCLRSKSCFMKNERLSLLRLCKSWCSALLFPCYTSSESCFHGSEILSKEKNISGRPTLDKKSSQSNIKVKE